VNAKDFRSARLFAVFGGYEVDLSRAEMAGNEAYVEANAVFGGGEIRVPLNWKVVLQGMGVFGGYNDKTQHVQPTGRLLPRRCMSAASPCSAE